MVKLVVHENAVCLLTKRRFKVICRFLFTAAGRTRRGKPLDIYGDMLKSHNYHRARHCAPPLVISERLNRIAQSYAEHLAATSTFEHSGNKLGDKALGENLYMEWISRGRAEINLDRCISSWYDEVAMHNFRKPKFSKETGHFTQMVWKATKTMGVGVAHSPDGREVYIVTNYYPAGNIVSPGYFEENVLPANC